MRYKIILKKDIHGGRQGPFNTFEEAIRKCGNGVYKEQGQWFWDNYGAGKNKGDVLTTHFKPELRRGVEIIRFMTGNHNETATIIVAEHLVVPVSDDIS